MHFQKSLKTAFRRPSKNSKTRKNERKQRRQNEERRSPTNGSTSSVSSQSNSLCSSLSTVNSQASKETLVRQFSRDIVSHSVSKEFFRMTQSPTPRNFPIYAPDVNNYPIRVASQVTFRVQTPAPVKYPIHRSPSPPSTFDSIRPRRSFPGKK